MGGTHNEVGAEDGEDHGRKLPLPVRVGVVLHGEEQRREAGPERADGDEDLRRHVRGEDGDDGLSVQR